VAAGSGQELVRFDQVALTFPGGSGRSPVEVIRELDLCIEGGEFVAVIGPSGTTRAICRVACGSVSKSPALSPSIRRSC